MNGYGHHILPFAWMRLYWLAFGVILFLLAVAIWSRDGTAFTIRNWRKLWSNVVIPLIKPFAICLSVLAAAFVVLYYNSRVLNNYESTATQTARRAEYERAFRKHDSVVQPRIVEVSLMLELEPLSRDFSAHGHYYLKNKSRNGIPEVHVQFSQDPHLTMDSIWFDRSSKALDKPSEFRYQRYALMPPLAPGDSVRMDFGMTFTTSGFELRGSNNQVVYNGTFLNQSYFPTLGYSTSFEITDLEKRLEYRLGSRQGLAVPQSLPDRNYNQHGDDADYIRFDVVIGTEHDQIAIAPGQLQRRWQENQRNYFHYKMEAPMGNFYSILSGRYAVQKIDWRGTSLEVYHHPDHDFNVGRMLEGMQDALSFCSDHFGVYPHGAIRIVEFPRYASYAQSFAQTIPFSEGIGFIFKVRDPKKDLDMAYYTTAHEVAHQWWGQLIMQSNTRGGSLLSEGLAQYSALMVMKQKFPPEVIERYLRYELKGYLTGRSAEREKEETLAETEGKNYLHYSKASLAFFALQDYVGEPQINRALGKFASKWAMREAPYPTSLDLIAELRAVTPDSLQYLITDLFESIILYDNVASQCYFEKVSANLHEVSLRVGSRKVLADSIGRETELPLADWIDIGIYGNDSDGTEKLLYLQKHKITRKEQEISVTVRGRPVRAGIDPLHKLIDRHPDDNKVEAKEVVDLATLPQL
jgi:hypothetical protein